MPSSLRAYLELSRLSNAPTVVSNVMVGTAIGVAGGTLDWRRVAGISAAVLCLYVGGMALNDVVDRAVDAERRPERPIPSGRITWWGAATFALMALLAGAVIVALVSPAALVPVSLLVAAIIIYDLTHKQAASAVVLMGLCRGLIYVSAAAAVAVPIDWSVAAPLAAALTVYVIALTIVARIEDGGRLAWRRWIVPAMPLVAVAPALVVRPETIEGQWVATAAGTAVIIWLILAARDVLASPPRLRGAVMRWLSGICLIDALYLGMLDQPVAGGIAIGLYLLTTLGHRAILGT